MSFCGPHQEFPMAVAEAKSAVYREPCFDDLDLSIRAVLSCRAR